MYCLFKIHKTGVKYLLNLSKSSRIYKYEKIKIENRNKISTRIFFTNLFSCSQSLELKIKL